MRKLIVFFVLIVFITSCSLLKKKKAKTLIGDSRVVEELVVKDSTDIVSILPEKVENVTHLNDSDTITLLFIGDIMGHSPQIKSAYNKEIKEYNYDNVFSKISPIISEVDYAIANLEVTLAGPPYKGYPQFSSPDELVVACKKNGIDLLMTANNHSCDRRKKGIIRTIDVLDSLNINHIGTYKNKEERDSTNLFLLTKGKIKIGILNYTYGTNGIAIPKPTIVNLINEEQILLDIADSKKFGLDKLVVFIHWGSEYQSLPNKKQKNIAKFLFNNGVDIIIGSHPHVIQPMEYNVGNDSIPEHFIAYSLGNFVSNQRARRKDGGVMVEISIIKENGKSKILDKGYHLYWVNKVKEENKNKFEIIPCSKYENSKFKGLRPDGINKVKIFIKDSRLLLNKNNKNVNEIFDNS